ncbi:MAG: ABC transporter permease [Bacteroidales bacterium]|nr:ABC transporter permease [Clostridium sp.]MCM1204286.1 ABC transporter permease [Bacteroidales bacterium]
MRQREHLWIHDKPAGSVMMITFCFTFFILVNVLRIQNMQSAAKEQAEKEHYRSSHIFQYQTSDTETVNSRIPMDKLNITRGNVIVVFKTVVGTGYSIAPIHMVISYNEPLVEELQEGRFPTDNEISHGRKCVVVGEGLLRLTEKKENSREMVINGVSYTITGVLKDITGDGNDNRVIVFYPCFSEKSMEDLNGEYWFDIEYGSNLGEIEQIDELQAWLYRFAAPEHFVTVDSEEMNKLNDARTLEQMMNRYKLFVLYGLFILCMGGCFIVSSIWIKRRRKEMIIRKAFGSSFWEISCIIFRDLLMIMGGAILMDIVIFSVQSVVTGKAIMRQEYLYHNLLYLIGAGVAVIFVTLIIPLYTVSKISPAEGTRNF